MKKKHYRLAFILLIIGLLSLFIRGAYVNALVVGDRYQDISFSPDSYQYTHLAQNIAKQKCYAQNNVYSRYLSVLRTPGYPLFYALFEYCGTAPVAILWSQVVIGACIPIFVALMAFMITKKLSAGAIAGFLSAISTPSIFLAGEIMADLLFAVVFIIGFFLLYYGILYLKKMTIIVAGLVFGLSSLIKPTTIIWPFYSIAVYYFLSKANKLNVKLDILLLFVAVQVAIIGGWSLRNYYTARIFSLSTIGVQTLRHYLAVEVNEVAKRENSPPTIVDSIRNEQKRLRKQVQFALNTGTTISQLHEIQFNESLNILFSNLYLAYICYKRNITENISSPNLWKFYSDKLPQQSLPNKFLPLLVPLNNFLTKIFFIGIILHLCSLPWLLKSNKNERLKRHFYTSLALILTYLYFALISGITFWTGPRIVYPAEFTLFILIATIGNCFFHSLSQFFKELKMYRISNAK